MDKPMWVKKLRQILSPGYVVNLCFFYRLLLFNLVDMA